LIYGKIDAFRGCVAPRGRLLLRTRLADFSTGLSMHRPAEAL